jgi:signal transduction histidine kinase
VNPPADAHRAAVTGSERADHIRALFEQMPAVLAGNAIGVALVVWAFWPLAPAVRIGGWLALALLLWSARLAHYLRYRSRRDADAATLLAWRASWRVLVLMQGLMWPLAVWLLWGLGSAFHTVALILIAVSYTLGSVQLLATQPTLFIAFVSTVLLPIVVRVATDTSQPWHWQLALVLGLLFAITLLMGRTYRDALSQAILLKQHTEHLAEQLKREKAAADEARRAAETANRAKTQFFAAASHDLRQPLHAMGLFAEALRQRSAQTHSDPEVSSLVNSINQSVDALESLFAELLDMTRIDTGGVEVQLAPVRLRELFSRLKQNFEPSTAATVSPTATACSSSASCATSSATPSATAKTAACSWPAGRAAASLCCKCGTAASASVRRACRTSSKSSTRCTAARRWRRTRSAASASGWRSSSAWPICSKRRSRCVRSSAAARCFRSSCRWAASRARSARRRRTRARPRSA